MTYNLTGPAHFRESNRLVGMAHHFTYGDGADPVAGNALATEALVHATNAQTAAIVMLAGVYAKTHDVGCRELEAWNEVIPEPPLVNIQEVQATRPEAVETPGAAKMCRCGHSEADHDAKWGDPQCSRCPGDEERSWRHRFTEETG